MNNMLKRVFSAINMQLEHKGRNMAYFLSGGLDSSAITALAARKFGDGINTFSLQYKGNDEFFVPTEYQPASDDYFIDKIIRFIGVKFGIKKDNITAVL